MTTYTTMDINIYTHEDDKTNIEISPSGDGLETICVKASTQYYGDIDFSMDLEVAEHFAKGILKQIEMMKEANVN